MALTNTNIPNSASDVVGVFDQNFNQVFSTARPVKCLADENAKAFEHPIEKGTVITDHIIFQPNEIELQVILPADEYRSVYQQIEQLYKVATVFNVQTRATTYTNMYIYKMPHQEDTDLFNTITMVIRLREILISPPGQALPATSVANPTDQSTINNGLQQPGATTALPAPPAFQSTDQGVPPASAFDPNSPGFKLNLPPGAQGPAPNAQSYQQYQDDLPPDINTGTLTLDQINQVLTAKNSSNARLNGPGF